VIIQKQPRAESALAREQEGDESHQWNLNEYLLAGIFDVLAAANWQRGGGKGPRPKQIPRPGVKETEVKKRGTTAVSIAELDAFLSRPPVAPAPAQPAARHARKRDKRGRFVKQPDD
jgi:hypothetical protein